MAQQALLAKHEKEKHTTPPPSETPAQETQITTSEVPLTEYVEKGHETPPPTLQKILTLKAHNTTLLALGGPDGNTVDPHGNWWASHPTVLAKAIRGAWRWWLRTLLQHEYNAENYQKLWEKEEELGLGSTSKATCYILEVELIEPEKISRASLSPQEIQKTLIKIIEVKKLEKRKKSMMDRVSQGRKATLRLDTVLKDSFTDPTEKLIAYMLTRLRYYVLLTTPYKSATFTRRNLRELRNLTPESLVQKLVYEGEHLHEFLYRKQPLLPGQLTIKVTLYRRRAFNLQEKKDECDTQIDNLAKKALFYALVIGGIGAATTRGFGKFTIIEIEDEKDENNKESKNTNENKNESNKAQQVQREIIRQYKDPKEVKDLKKHEEHDKQNLPSLPDIDKAIKIAIQSSETQDILDILAKISDAVRKYEWKAASQRLGLTWRPPYKEHGDRYHTWVLGLPRSVGFTGYFINFTEPGRWKSPFIFTPIQEDGNWKILLTLFPLKDAEYLLYTRSYQLYWRGKYADKVRSLKLLFPSGQLREWSVKDAYEAALEWITEILGSR